MGEVASLPQNTTDQTANVDPLVELANRIKSYHKAVEDAAKNIVEKAMAAGRDLIEAKGKVPHGRWLPWLEKECGLSERTAQRYMRLAGGKKKIDLWLREKSATMADLTLAEVERVIADDYGKAQASLIKKLGGLPPEDVEQRAQATILALREAVAAIKNPTSKVA